MKKTSSLKQLYDNPVINLCLDTISRNKQALVFVNTKNSAEAEAERVSKKLELRSEAEKAGLEELSAKALNILEKPTRQCKRLAFCLKKGIAFHHSGLHSQQRELIEDNFKKGLIKIICATPTLAMGIDMPAFRVIIRDLKRFAPPRGMTWIPVLEYEQFCGRAGRPDFNDQFGEAICVAGSDSEKENIMDNYVMGDNEEILSKLAVEPVLRTYVLSLIATGYADSEQELVNFFKRTFYAHQFGDTTRLRQIIDSILDRLDEWGFISISESRKLKPTRLGLRINQLYLDPYTAHYLINCMNRAKDKLLRPFSYLQMVAYTLELRPLLTVRTREYDLVQDKSAEYESSMLSLEPSMFEPEYEEFLKSIKTAWFFNKWIEEADDEELMEQFNVRPGEARSKLERADWLLYASQELAKLIRLQGLIGELAKLRLRLKYGAKQELLPLLRLRNIGRARARKLYNNKVRSLEELRKVDLTSLSQLIGHKTALSLKKQVGQDLSDQKVQVKKGKRKGQLSIKKFDKKKNK